MKLKQTFFAMAMLFASAIIAQPTTVSIGTGTSYCTIPASPNAESYTQTIFHDTQIGMSGNITELRFKRFDTQSYTNAMHWRVYLGNTTQDRYYGGLNDWIPVGSMTQVFDGNVTVTSTEVIVYFQTPFNYNGADNLVIAVNEVTLGKHYSAMLGTPWNETPSSPYAYSKQAANFATAASINEASPMTADQIATVDLQPNVDIIFGTCVWPSAITAANPGQSTMEIGWTNGQSESEWQIEAVELGNAQGTGIVQGAITNPHTFTGLNHSTEYEFYVRSICSVGDSSRWEGVATGTTLCGVHTCFEENFDLYDHLEAPNCFTTVGPFGTGVAAGNPGSLVLHVGGSAATYVSMPEFASLNAGTLNFRARSNLNQSPYNQVVVGTMSDPTNSATFTPLTTLSLSTAWSDESVDLFSYSGTDKYLTFHYANAINGNTFVYVDEITFDAGICVYDKVYVDHAATGNNDGTSWADAYTDLQTALTNFNGDDIWVAAGTYKPHATDRSATFSIPSGAKIYGGFDKTETNIMQRDLESNPSILSGDLAGNDNSTILDTEPTRQDNSYHIITFKGNVQNCLLDGFTISGGNANGATSNSCSTPAINQYVHSRGGAVYANPYATGHATSGTLSRCTFENNTGSQYAVYGAFGPCGVTNYSHDVDFDRCVFRNNYSGSASALLYYSSGGYGILGYGTVSNSLFHDNTSGSGAACITYSASTSNGGSATALSANVINCTFSNNSGNIGSVISSFNASNVRFRNSIAWDNGSVNPLVTTGGAGLVAQNSIVEGGYGGTATNADPMFADAGSDDYTLMSGSPAIGFGDNSFVTNFNYDLPGNDRVLDGTVDAGAYEYSVAPCVSSAPTIDGFSNLSHKGTTISWTPTDVPTGGKFVVRYHKFGDSPNFSWKVVPADRTSAYINGLDANQRYVFRVGGRCDGETMAAYSDTMSVTTKPYCPPATNLNGVRTSGETATISWDDMGADVYKIKYRETGGSWIYRNVAGPATTLDLTALTGGSTYEWKIRTICNDGGNKPYSDMQNIGTYNPRLASTDIEGYDTYPNPTNGWVNLEFNSNTGGDIRIAVRDLSGRVLIQETINVSEGNVRTRLDLTDLSTGTYLVELTENSGLSHTSRVMKR